MQSDQIWQIVRYILIAVGTYLASIGKIPMADVSTAADALIQVFGAVVAALSVIWGLYVKWNTATVPAQTATRIDVPVVNTATGTVNR